MNKRSMALFMAATAMLSLLFGFAGAYTAHLIYGSRPIVQQLQDVDAQRTMLTRLNDLPLGGPGLSIPEIVRLNADSVVEIVTETVSSGGRIGQFVSEGAGSGVIVDSAGHIVTNNHVIEGASRITVRLRNGESYSASLVGRDARTDLAVIRISAPGLIPARPGDSGKLVVGELAVAIGNPLGQLGGTVTEGIISALDRDIEIDGESMKLLQTSAAINPGNSGGGLFNSRGELVGIVNAKSSGSGIEGLGFAIPINTVETVVEQLIQHGYVPGRIDLGVTLLDIPTLGMAMMYRVPSTGVYVQRVLRQSGLQVADRIISINGQPVLSSRDVKALTDVLNAGDTATFVVERNRRSVTLNIILEQAR